MTTSSTSQWNPGSTTQVSQTLTGLTPGSSYVILVRAYTNNSDGTKTYSDYASIPYTDSGVSASGLNALTVNNGTDILLNGGAIYAQNTTNPFKPNVGVFDVVNGTTTGTGVILNNTGLAAFKAGTREFYIDAKTGNAYFAGTVQATIIESTGYSSGDVTDGSAYSSGGMAINLNNGSITAKQFRIDASGNAYFGGTVSGAIWSGSQTLSQYVNSVSQTAANGKNKITYSATTGIGANSVAVSATAGFAPDGNVYSSFPSTITATLTNQQAGDTYFSFNNAGNIIAQYTAASSNSWSITTITSTVIANLDAGKITAGTINAAISITSATITGSTFETPHFSGTTVGWTGVGITSSGNSDQIQFSSKGVVESYIYYNPNIDGGSFYISGPGSNTVYLGNGGIVLDDPSTITLTAGTSVAITSGSSSIYIDDSVGVYLNSSTPSSGNGLRNISLTSTTGTPATAGNDGDIVLVWS